MEFLCKSSMLCFHLDNFGIVPLAALCSLYVPKKSLNFMDAGLVSLVLRRVEYETLKLSQSLWMHFIVMNKNQWYL